MKTAKIFTDRKRAHNKAVKNLELPIFTERNKFFPDYIMAKCHDKKDRKLVNCIKYIESIGFEKLRAIIPNESKTDKSLYLLRCEVYLKMMFKDRVKIKQYKMLICDLYYYWTNQNIVLKDFNK